MLRFALVLCLALECVGQGQRTPRLSELCSEDTLRSLRERLRRRERSVRARELELKERERRLREMETSLRSKKNVLLILADDLRPQLSCYGHPEVVTPAIDAFARRALRFDRAYCNAPSCNPSRNALLTGRRPHASGVYFFEGSAEHFLGVDATTMPQFFRGHGYEAFGVGKVFHWEPWANTFSARNGKYYPESYSQEWGCDPQEETDPMFAHLGGCASPSYLAGCPKYGQCDTSLPYDDDLPEEFFFDHRVATKAIQLLRQARQYQLDRNQKAPRNGPPEKPFFMAVGFRAPHVMWHFPRQVFNETYRSRSDFPIPGKRMPAKGSPPLAVGHETPAQLHTYEGVNVDPERWGFAKNMPNLDGADFEKDSVLQKALRDTRKYYAASVTFLDMQFARLMEELDRLGIANDTVVCFTTDHAYSLGEGARWGKYTLFESDTRVPLLIFDPDKPQSWGKSTMQIAELVDILPTLADLAGVPVDEDPSGPAFAWMDGESLADLFGAGDGVAKARSHKSAAFSVQPRCIDRELDQDEYVGSHTCLGRSDEWHLRFKSGTNVEGPIMGVSMRTHAWRFTRWMYWNHTIDGIDWNRKPYAEELYMHPEDLLDPSTRQKINLFDIEAENQVLNPDYHDIVEEFRAVMAEELDPGKLRRRYGTDRARVTSAGTVPEARTGPFGGRPGLLEERMEAQGW